MDDTIFALSSGAPPAAIAIIRISGPQAGAALTSLAGPLPAERRASVRALRDGDGGLLDTALVLWFPGPRTATGEDLAELHLHGGRAVVAAVERALAEVPGLRRARPGEFTRRAFDHGVLDLAEAEGLADLLAAETESQRVQALGAAEGHVSRQILAWQTRLTGAAAAVEAAIDFSDEDDVGAAEQLPPTVRDDIAALTAEWRQWLAAPAAERIRDGLSVVIAGPPNSGKSTLLNALARREVAIASPQAGTTRDIIEVPLALDGIAFRFADTAGLHAGTGDDIERIGMERARGVMATADILLWLGPVDEAPDHPARLIVGTMADLRDTPHADAAISATTGAGMDRLHRMIVDLARAALPREGEIALLQRQRAALAEGLDALELVEQPDIAADLVLVAEHLRIARAWLDSITGTGGTEAMLDALFGRFCIGK